MQLWKAWANSGRISTTMLRYCSSRAFLSLAASLMSAKCAASVTKLVQLRHSNLVALSNTHLGDPCNLLWIHPATRFEKSTSLESCHEGANWKWEVGLNLAAHCSFFHSTWVFHVVTMWPDVRIKISLKFRKMPKTKEKTKIKKARTRMVFFWKKTKKHPCSS